MHYLCTTYYKAKQFIQRPTAGANSSLDGLFCWLSGCSYNTAGLLFDVVIFSADAGTASVTGLVSAPARFFTCIFILFSAAGIQSAAETISVALMRFCCSWTSVFCSASFCYWYFLSCKLLLESVNLCSPLFDHWLGGQSIRTFTPRQGCETTWLTQQLNTSCWDSISPGQWLDQLSPH